MKKSAMVLLSFLFLFFAGASVLVEGTEPISFWVTMNNPVTGYKGSCLNGQTYPFSVSATACGHCGTCWNGVTGSIWFNGISGSCSLGDLHHVYDTQCWPSCGATGTLSFYNPQICYQACAQVNPGSHCGGGSACTNWYCVSCDGCKSNGQPCSNADECCSLQCVDGVCCNSACAGVCEGCNFPGHLGTCSPDPEGTFYTLRKGYGDGSGDMYVGNVGWADLYDRCCQTASDNINKNGMCVRSYSTYPGSGVAAEVGGQPGIDRYSVPFGRGVDEDGWLECDYYAQDHVNGRGWCSNVCPDGFVYAGEPGVGEYPAGTADGGRADLDSNAYGSQECCGDDYREYYITTGIGYELVGGRCCANSTDCVDSIGVCRDGVEHMDLVGTCSDGPDNDCDGEYDWDSQIWYGSGGDGVHHEGRHGDDGCPVGIPGMLLEEGQC